MLLNALAHEIHAVAVAKGWWDGERDFGMLLALIHSEVSEALEEYRAGNRTHVYYQPIGTKQQYTSVSYDALPDDVKARIMAQPEGIGIELADVIIRVLDLCAQYEIDIDDAVKRKMAYNRTRPHRHGGKLA